LKDGTDKKKNADIELDSNWLTSFIWSPGDELPGLDEAAR
jgi:hypothetical protein